MQKHAKRKIIKKTPTNVVDPERLFQDPHPSVTLKIHNFKQCCGSETKVSDPVSDPDPA